MANEGKLLAIVASDSAAAILRKMREHPLGRDAHVIGEVVSDHPGMVLMKTGIGGTRVVDVLFGEQLAAHLLTTALQFYSRMIHDLTLAKDENGGIVLSAGFREKGA